MNSTPAFFKHRRNRRSHRIGNPYPGIGLRALHGWNREAGTTSDLGLGQTEHDAGSAQLSWAGHYLQTLPPSDDPKVSQSQAVPTISLDLVGVPF